MFILSTGCQGRAVPKDLPPRSTLFDYLDLCSLDGTLDRMHHALYVACRKRDDREAGPTNGWEGHGGLRDRGHLGSLSAASQPTKNSRGGTRRETGGYLAGRDLPPQSDEQFAS
jgi:hypothetical protein